MEPPRIAKAQPSPMRVAELVIAAQLGDRSATEALARRFLRPAYSIALSIVRRPSDAEDVAQDAVISSLSKIQHCRDPEAFAGWLVQIVRNQALNHLKKRGLRDPIGEESDPPAQSRAASTQNWWMRKRLLNALEALSDVQREVVLLHDLAGYTHPEIADVLGISVVSSRQYLFVARKELRSRLERDEVL